MYEYLEKLFGKDEQGNPVALTFEQLSEKLKEAKDVKLANLAEGGYVSKEKYDALETKNGGLEDQLKTANETIQSYKDMDIEGIKASVDNWKDKYEKDTQALNDKLTAQERQHCTDLFFNGFKFSSKAAKNGIRAEFDSLNLPIQDGVLVGAEEFMNKLKADDEYKGAFVDETPAGGDDANGGDNSNGKPQFSQSNTQGGGKPKGKVSLLELMKQKNENPKAEIKFD